MGVGARIRVKVRIRVQVRVRVGSRLRGGIGTRVWGCGRSEGPRHLRVGLRQHLELACELEGAVVPTDVEVRHLCVCMVHYTCKVHFKPCVA